LVKFSATLGDSKTVGILDDEGLFGIFCMIVADSSIESLKAAVSVDDSSALEAFDED